MVARQGTGTAGLVLQQLGRAQPRNVHIHLLENLGLLLETVDQALVTPERSRRNLDLFVVVGTVIHKEKPYLGNVGAQFPSPSASSRSTTSCTPANSPQRVIRVALPPPLLA